MGLFGSKTKKEDRIETYEECIDCDNCGTSEYFKIPKGTNIFDFEKNTKCDNCGCILNGNDREDD